MTEQRDPRQLKPHPRNQKIYGQESTTDLRARVEQSGWIKPLVVTPGDLIISGHQRREVAIELDWPTVPVEVRHFADEAAELEALLLENASRDKTAEQKVREAECWREIEASKAVARMSEAAIAQHQGSENFHTPDAGRTTDKVAERVGFGSGRTYEKAAKVVEVIDREEAAGNKETAAAMRTVLNDQSVDAAFKIARLPDQQRERVAEKINTKIEAMKAAPNGPQKPIDVHTTITRVQREDRHEAIGATAAAMPAGQFQVFYADPPWRYEFSETESRAIENQYPTMTLDDICALPVADMAADDAMLFMWATNPKLEEAMRVIKAWGFEYRTNMVWVKDKIGMGYYCRSQHELLLVARRGSFPVPLEEHRPASVLRGDRVIHSRKPEEMYRLIEAMYPAARRVELFCRTPQPGWDVWGNQAEQAAG